MSASKTKGARLVRARQQAGLSQQALADKVQTARTTIARVEGGLVSPSVKLALDISRELGESVETLFGGDR